MKCLHDILSVLLFPPARTQHERKKESMAGEIQCNDQPHGSRVGLRSALKIIECEEAGENSECANDQPIGPCLPVAERRRVWWRNNINLAHAQLSLANVNDVPWQGEALTLALASGWALSSSPFSLGSKESVYRPVKRCNWSAKTTALYPLKSKRRHFPCLLNTATINSHSEQSLFTATPENRIGAEIAYKRQNGKKPLILCEDISHAITLRGTTHFLSPTVF